MATAALYFGHPVLLNCQSLNTETGGTDMCHKTSVFKEKWLKVWRGAKLHNEYMQPYNIKKRQKATFTLKESVGK